MRLLAQSVPRVESSDYWWALGILVAVIALMALATQIWRVKPTASTVQKAPDPDPNNPDKREKPALDEVARRRSFSIRSLYLGKDLRSSTSKSMALLWTIAVGYALVVLGVYAVRRHFPVFSTSAGKLQPEYLLLLGGPFAAAVLSAQIVGTKTEQKVIQKVTAETPEYSPTQWVVNDAGDADLVDLQYVFFNLIALAYFIGRFVSSAGTPGLPDLPDTLVGLTSVGALAYITNKSLQQNGPRISTYQPLQQRPGDTFTVLGANFVPPGSPDEGTHGVSVTIDGKATRIGGGVSDNRIEEVEIPRDVTAGAQEVIVTTAAGVSTKGPKFSVVADKAAITRILQDKANAHRVFIWGRYLSPAGVALPLHQHSGNLPRVTFHGVLGKVVKVERDGVLTKLTVDAPSPPNAPVVVTTASGEHSDGFKQIEPPS